MVGASCLSVGDREARADRQSGELIDRVAAGPPVGKLLLVDAEIENPGGGSPGFSRTDDRHRGDSIAANNKQHRAAIVHTHMSDFHNY
jgi:hypothetical protein